MDGTKSLFISRTFWGAMLMMVSSALAYFGVDFGAEDQSQLAYILAEVGGFVLTIWGRVSASKTVELKKSTTALGVMFLLCFTLPACALKGAPAHEQAMAVTNECIVAYESLHQEYLHLHAALPEQREFLETKVAPVLDTAKTSLVSLGDATALWARTKTKPADWDGLKTRAMNLLSDASAMLARIKGAGS